MDSGTSGTRADDLEFGRCGLVKVWTLRRRLRDNVDFVWDRGRVEGKL